MSDLAVYFDRIADEFNGYYTGRRPTFIQELGYRVFRGPGLKRRFSDTVRIVGDCGGARILDVGSGPGVYSRYFAKNNAAVTSIDISANMIELARLNLVRDGINNVSFIIGDFMKYEFDSKFDYALAIGLFDYIDAGHRNAYFSKLSELTTRKFVATFPKMFVFQAPVRKFLFIIKRQPVYFYTAAMIKKLAKRHNLVARFYNSGPIWTVEFIKQ